MLRIYVRRVAASVARDRGDDRGLLHGVVNELHVCGAYYTPPSPVVGRVQIIVAAAVISHLSLFNYSGMHHIRMIAT